MTGVWIKAVEVRIEKEGWNMRDVNEIELVRIISYWIQVRTVMMGQNWRWCLDLKRKYNEFSFGHTELEESYRTSNYRCPGDSCKYASAA